MHCYPSEPDKLPAEFLDQVFDGQRKRKNFIVWLQSPYGGPSIRVNAKYAPKNTYVPVPDNLMWNRKTTMIQLEGIIVRLPPQFDFLVTTQVGRTVKDGKC